MKPLNVKVRNLGKTLIFSGDTFSAKDLIKSLGKCSWNAAEKNWLVENSTISKDDLKSLFPLANFEIEKDWEEPIVQASSHADKEFELNSSSVSGLLSSIKQTISAKYPFSLKVYGVLSSVKKLSSKRVYFDLLDNVIDGISLRAVIWESKFKELEKFESLNLEFSDNTPVLLEVNLSFNIKNGQISLVVDKIIPEYTLGKLQAQREKTNERLIKEGIFYKNKSLQFAFLPRKLGILTSESGTVINDFKASLEVSNFGFKLFWYPIRVQGDFSEKDVINGIKYFQSKDVDAILLFRGGGSATELAVFNSYEIAKSICLSKIPVVSAIGHEYDQSSTQDVSYKYFGVPKDLGRFFSDIVISHRETLADFGTHLLHFTMTLISIGEKDLSLISYHLLRNSREVFNSCFDKIKQITIKLRNQTNQSFEDQEFRLTKVASGFLTVMRNRIDRARNKTKYSVSTLVKLSSSYVAKIEYRLANKTQQLISEAEQVYENLNQNLLAVHNLFQIADNIVKISTTKLGYVEELLKSFSPELQLSRGFALIRNPKTDQIITSMENFRTATHVLVEMADGEVEISFKIEKDKLNENRK